VDAPPDGPPPEPLSPLFDTHPPPGVRLAQLRQRAMNSAGSAGALFEMAGPQTVAALPVQTASGHRYVLTALMHSPRFGRPAAAPRTQLFGGLVALLLSGLVCFGLVRYLTAPLITLRAATRQLARGDLTARTGAAKRARRDEVADLGRDFDAMAARLEALVESQRQLLGDISHELRSPLSRLSMALALARRHAAQSPSEEVTVALERIGREATRLNTLIGQLLELTRLESGESEGAAEVVDLEELVREVVADADFEAQNTEHTVQLVGSQSCRVTGSRDLLHSALENVVRNAVRHTAPGTPVEVSLACESAEAIIRVRDHGPGVPDEALEQLFRPFYRVEAARDRESGGVGLGLAITQRAIRSHGGSVSATNAPGGGLQIELRLPASVA